MVLYDGPGEQQVVGLVRLDHGSLQCVRAGRRDPQDEGDGEDGAQAHAPSDLRQAAGRKMARKSLTLVRVGPVQIKVPRHEKKP